MPDFLPGSRTGTVSHVMNLSVLAIAAPLLAPSSTGTPSVPVITATPMAEAHQACETGSALCQVVTSTTGSSTIGAWTELLVGLPLRILLIVLVAVVLRWLLHKLIRRIVEQVASGGGTRNVDSEDRVGSWLGRRASSVFDASPLAYQRRAQRARTIGTVLRSGTTGTIFVVTVLMVLSELGLNIAPLLASAGIVGMAIGFGAQSLVKDFLSGMFMIMEDQYGVGDAVNLGAAVGTVESVGLRVTQVRDVGGTLWYVPNGQITQVGNMSQGWSRAVVDITVGYGTDLSSATKVMLQQADELAADPEWKDLIVEPPEVWGVEQMSNVGVVLRVVAKTAPTQHVKVARELRRRITAAFKADGIAFPFNGAPPSSAKIAGAIEPPTKTS